jgi:arylsulfatase A-like enzyme
VDETTVFSSLDFFTTFAEIAGAPLSASTKSEGQSMIGALLGKETTRTAPLCWEYGRNTNSFAYPGPANRSPNVAMRDGHWKLLVSADGRSLELYNLDRDRGEKRNLAAEDPTRAEKMKSAAWAWRNALP